ncbi:RagB/SusD family nutrient uptake outer membrane protein [Pseudobacter ginsenosidimutans]|uniref:SusD-like starch-binding protein associating with outer membrane n=1 Tax=Pseudobacter ginsenosidimutans TaxID=661488 RepID=A0A4Q7MQM9_9BACT|nr:RagB/SusD family nutrient uptake outer membrane protein [Pseudobacter ginsenosidimutans]QEC42128.1 RagB/SusD family nutrient uptake outer membrane protein [Pseudobacter ginsenosidimutans]RZS71032.1 SusD-like starch-binding protein associating with outer membrane [Pseudobacter ginsenosidimutans]
MKSSKYFLIAFLVITAVSCKKWLDVKPTSELDRSEIFSSERGYREALTGVYANLTKPELYGRETTWGIVECMAGTYGAGMAGNYRTFATYGYKKTNPNYWTGIVTFFNPIWTGVYKQIANLNSLLETIDGNKGIFSGDNYNIVKGEALGLRAYLHFELLCLYGPSYASGGANTPAIPYIDKLTTMISPMLTVDSAMGLIIRDLEASKKLLVNDPMHMGTTPPEVLAPLPGSSYSSFGVASYHNRRFNFNYYAAIATLARAYMWKGDKVNALLQAKEIMADQSARFPWVKSTRVVPPTAATSEQDKTYATETIFALNIKLINDYQDGLIYQGTKRLSSFALCPHAYSTSGTIFEGSTDLRKNNLATSYSGSIAVSNKFHQVTGITSVYSFFQERVPLIRTAEIYYIAAECESDPSVARLYVDSVRSKRGLANMPLSPAITRTDLDIEIRKEYQKEFIGEGRLWFFQKRKDLDLASAANQAIYKTSAMFLKNAYVLDRPDDEDGNR